MNLGLKLGSPDFSYGNAINNLWQKKAFQYIELLAVPNTYKNTIDFWKQFKIPFIIHAPHSGHGMNPSIKETFEFANTLNAEWIILGITHFSHQAIP